MQVFAALCGAKVTNRLSDFLGGIGHPDATNHHRSVSRVSTFCSVEECISCLPPHDFLTRVEISETWWNLERPRALPRANQQGTWE